MGSYIAVTFGAIQFAEFVESRYGISDNLVERVGLFLALTLPAFVIFVFNHGRKGRDRWRPFEKVFIPVSLVGAALFSIFAFGNSTVQAMTEEVQIINDEGEEEVRIVPKAEFTKKLVSFPFENRLSKEQEWLSIAAPVLLDSDLEQDMRVYTVEPTHLQSEYESYGQDFPSAIPFASQVKIAQDLYTDYFVSGELAQGQEKELQLTVKVCETATGRVYFESTREGDDIYDLVDETSSELMSSLYLPDAELDAVNVIDLPVRDLITSNQLALQKYIEALVVAAEDVQQMGEAIELLRQSIAADPNCADCHHMLGVLLYNSGIVEESREVVSKAKQLASNQPERKQLAIRLLELNVQADVEQMIRLLERWRTLYPSDLNPYSMLMRFYPLLMQFDKAKQVGRDAIEIGHRGSMLTQLASLYIRTEEYSEAEALLKQFAELYPHKANETSEIAEIYVGQGRLEDAINYYEDLQLMADDDAKNLTGLSDVYDRVGKFSDAEKLLRDGLQKMRTTADSFEIYNHLQEHFLRLGSFESFHENLKNSDAMLKKIAPPGARAQLLIPRFDEFYLYQKKEIAEEYQAELVGIIPQLKDNLECVSEFIYAIAVRDSELYEENLGRCRETIIGSNGGQITYYLDAISLQFAGKYEEATAKFEEFASESGAAAKEFEGDLLNLYRLSKSYDRANELSENYLKSDPSNAKILLEVAKLRYDQNNKKEAGEILSKVLEIWKDADPDYLRYQEALNFGREKLELSL